MGTGQDEHGPHTSESHLLPGRGRGSKAFWEPGRSGLSRHTRAPSPSSRQTPPSWCDPRARSTARSFLLFRLLAPHPGPHPSYLPLLFEGAQPTQIYMFVCLPVCLSRSLPISVAQLMFLSRSSSWSLWSQIHEAGTPVDAEGPAYRLSPAPKWLRTTNPSMRYSSWCLRSA